VTNEQLECIRAAARRYVHEQAPSQPMEVLERVARIVLQATSAGSQPRLPGCPIGQTIRKQHDGPEQRSVEERATVRRGEREYEPHGTRLDGLMSAKDEYVPVSVTHNTAEM